VVEAAAFWWMSERPRLGLHWPSMRRELDYGLPTAAIVLLGLSLGSVDRLVILGSLGEEKLGYYGIALILVMVLGNLAAIPSMVLSPRLSEAYGRLPQASDRAQLAPRMREPLPSLSAGFSLLLGVLWLTVPALVGSFLPKYVPGLSATRLAMIGAYCTLGVGVAHSALSATGRMRIDAVVLFFDTAFSYGLARLFVHLHPSLESVALALAIGNVWHMGMMMGAAHLCLDRPLREGLRTTGAILVPLAYSVGVAMACDHLVGRFVTHPWPWGHALVALAAYALLTAPLSRRLLRTVRLAS